MTVTVLEPAHREPSPGFVVRRALPVGARRTVGPFVFFDHFGPVTLEHAEDADVRPHPHIGLATVTWLFDGKILHRDSLGSAQPIRPGEVDWTAAGRLATVEPGAASLMRTSTAARVAVFGGDPLDGPRFVWWNFVSSDRARIEAAKARWRDDAFPRIEGETERIPLPD
ncbi:MAG: pirin family protein [Burkholderiaceae bacterium]|jgi:redox-sensitive bicupin YhaK (pirin superfamily)|nr:pirin family protein [Burkholderiales bacterium]MCZ8107448.1 pirin family protein [Burkholderiales bacterium]MCZ8337943.1 pirin family protein [Burkholderiaceae bacterium]